MSDPSQETSLTLETEIPLAPSLNPNLGHVLTLSITRGGVLLFCFLSSLRRLQHSYISTILPIQAAKMADSQKEVVYKPPDPGVMHQEFRHPPIVPPVVETPPPQKTVCGIPRIIFWLIVVIALLVIVVIGIAVGLGVGLTRGQSMASFFLQLSFKSLPASLRDIYHPC